MLLTLASADGTKMEVVECSARSGDSFNITRAADDTTAEAFKTGDKVSLRLSAGTRTSNFIGADGKPLTGGCAVYRLHPAAVWRLETLMQDRYVTSGNPMILPVPRSMVVRDAQGFTSARWFEPDEAISGISGKISFHDARGLIVDAIYVAALFADLQAWLVGLTGKASTSPANGSGGVQSIVTAMGSKTLVHCVDLHGNIYQPALPAATLVTKDSGGNQTGTVPATGLVTLNAGDGIDAASGDQNRLRWGWATNGVLARTKLVPPTLPSTGSPAPSLPRQFYRLAVVDTTWALLGNRTGSKVLDIPADDQTIPTDLLPKVRDQVAIDYLTDGPDTLAQASTVMTRPSQGMILAVSPVLDGGMSVPTQTGTNAHWPAFPTPNSNAGFPSPPASVKDGLSATWTSGDDVVVTIAADKVPDGAHIRIYPQQFVTIPAITQSPSFVRGNGGGHCQRRSADSDPPAQSFPVDRRPAEAGSREPDHGHHRGSAAGKAKDVGSGERPGSRRTGGRPERPLRRHKPGHGHGAHVRIGSPVAAVRHSNDGDAAGLRAVRPDAVPALAGLRGLAAARSTGADDGPLRHGTHHRGDRRNPDRDAALGSGLVRRTLGSRIPLRAACQRQSRQSRRPGRPCPGHTRDGGTRLRPGETRHAASAANHSLARQPQHNPRLGSGDGR